jgi:hypothetical protein
MTANALRPFKLLIIDSKSRKNEVNRVRECIEIAGIWRRVQKRKRGHVSMSFDAAEKVKSALIQLFLIHLIYLKSTK